MSSSQTSPAAAAAAAAASPHSARTTSATAAGSPFALGPSPPRVARDVLSSRPATTSSSSTSANNTNRASSFDRKQIQFDMEAQRKLSEEKLAAIARAEAEERERARSAAAAGSASSPHRSHQRARSGSGSNSSALGATGRSSDEFVDDNVVKEARHRGGDDDGVVADDDGNCYSDEDVEALQEHCHQIEEKVSSGYTGVEERKAQRRRQERERKIAMGIPTSRPASSTLQRANQQHGGRYVPEVHRQVETEEEAAARLEEKRRREKLDPEELELMQRLQDQRERITSRSDLIQRSFDSGIPLSNWVRKDKQQLMEEQLERERAAAAEVEAKKKAAQEEEELKEARRAAGLDDNGMSPERTSDGCNAMDVFHSALFEPAAGAADEMAQLMDRFRTTSIRNPDVAALVQDLCLPGAVDLILPDPHRFIESRIGDLLGSRYILKRDVFSATARPDFVGVMGGAPLFRMVPKFNVGAVSQPHSSGIRTILNEVAVEWGGGGGKCCWINLRDDPHIFLNQRSYSLRRHENPAEPIVTTGILAHRIEAMEEKLRREVVGESTRRGGNVIVHRESGSGIVDSQWEAVDEDTVLTTESLFKIARVQAHANYVRLPFSARDISLARIDDIFKLCLRYPDDPMIFCCQTGRGRSTFATVLACTCRYYQHQAKGIDTQHTVLDTIGKYNARSLSLLLAIVQVLPEGHKHERRVCLLCQVAGASSNFLDRMLMSFKSDRSSGTGRSLLNRYVHLVAFSRYCEEMLTLNKPRETFSSWVAANSEVGAVIRQCTAFVNEVKTAEESGLDTQATEAAAAMLGKLKWRQSNEVLTVATALVPERERLPEQNPPVPGVFALRQPDDAIPIMSAGHMTAKGTSNLLRAFTKAFSWVGALYVVDVRAEPTVYIDGQPFTLCDATALAEGSPRSSVVMTRDRTEDLERKLSFDVRNELESQGAIHVHRGDDDLAIVETKIDGSQTPVNSIRTPREFFEQHNEFSVNLRYVRVPVPHQDFMDVRACGDLVKQFYRCGDRSGLIIIDQDGALRSTLALNAAMLVRSSLYRPLQEMQTEHDLRLALKGSNPPVKLEKPLCTRTFLAEPFWDGDMPAEIRGSESTGSGGGGDKQQVELLLASQLSQMLAAGSLLGFVECVVQMCGRGNCWNTLDAVSHAKEAWTRATGTMRDSWLKKCFSYVNLYLGVLLMAIYVDRVQRNQVDTDYENFLELNSEVFVAIEKAREHPKAGLKFVLPQNLYLDTQVGSVSRRKGNVLTANFGLKADHFPGAIRKNMVPYLPGVPNFRKTPGANVYGVAIPTVRGVFNLLRLLGSATGAIEPAEPTESIDALLGTCHPRYALFHPTPDALTSEEVYPRPRRGRTIWVNLREEPLLYIGDRPFVFRDLATPYVNVEFTGITTEKIESIENILMEDVLAEARAHTNRFLIHDEIEPGRMGGLWEAAKPEHINTVRQLYEKAEKMGCRVEFVRLPVTDEQTPEIDDFDVLVERLLPEIVNTPTIEGESTSFVFNCQMGRGRTTTGMVICCMLIGLTRTDYYEWLDEIYPDTVIYPESASEFAHGNYRLIRALSRVLLDYRDAKHRTDLILEACSKLQNLRSAIETFKNMLESSESTEEARMRAFHHGTHYLLRYFYLIVFNSYLHEEFDPIKKTMKSTFRQWVDAHHEVVKTHERPDLK